MTAAAPPTLVLVRDNIARGDVVVVRHAEAQLRRRGIAIDEVIDGAVSAELVEDYPHDDAGPAVLLLQRDHGGAPLHVVWRIEASTAGPAILVTAYRPDPTQWDDTWRRRRGSGPQ